jgi:hypothetical protein
MLKLPLKKLVVELRYKPELGFYSKMDAIGIDLAEDYPDWERSPLTLEVRSKKKHRRLFLSVRRAFIEADQADSDTEFSTVESLLKKVCSKLEVKTLERIGVRQWFAADLNKSFALMVDQTAERFLLRTPEVSGILGDKTKDVAYVVDYESPDGWLYHLRLGPMLKSQWFMTVAHEPRCFEDGEDAKETFEKFQESFPEQFLFIDMDCYKEDQPVDKVNGFLTSARRHSHELAKKLIEYCKK